jgi:uncharacterized protein (TIGR02246 family)
MTSSTEKAITSLLGKYQLALNASDVEGAISLYAEDGIFMAEYNLSAIGTASLRTAYENVFKKIQLNVTFTVAEVVEMAPTWAFARTNSAGHTFNHLSQATTVEANQELFIFRKSPEGAWQIARYCFATTNPSR